MMPGPLSKKEEIRRLKALERTKSKKKPQGSVVQAARALGMKPGALGQWLVGRGQRPGHLCEFTRDECIAELRELAKQINKIPTRQDIEKGTKLRTCWRYYWLNMDDFLRDGHLESIAMQAPAVENQDERALKALKGGVTLDDLAVRLHITKGQALDLCDSLKGRGFNVFDRSGRYTLEAVPAPRPFDESLHLFESDKDGWYRYGFVTDNHLCSKYAREDVLHDLYDKFAAEGITRVYNAGNWIDGEARFNRHDLLIHGMDNQLRYFAERYPVRPGIKTYYIAGDDHEGWYAKDKGIDIGLRAQQTARDAGRDDLHYLGYMESFVTLRRAGIGTSAQMMVVHPGGGSTYALSYAPQKYVEALQGGEKPAVVMFGHWHKMDVFNYRNVWIIQGGTTEDQTPFMRKLKIEAHVGGVIVELQQDERGAIVRCRTEQIRYFDRGYYNGLYSMAGDINRERIAA